MTNQKKKKKSIAEYTLNVIFKILLRLWSQQLLTLLIIAQQMHVVTESLSSICDSCVVCQVLV